MAIFSMTPRCTLAQSMSPRSSWYRTQATFRQATITASGLAPGGSCGALEACACSPDGSNDPTLDDWKSSSPAPGLEPPGCWKLFPEPVRLVAAE